MNELDKAADRLNQPSAVTLDGSSDLKDVLRFSSQSYISVVDCWEVCQEEQFSIQSPHE